MTEIVPGTGKKERIDWTEEFEFIEESYVPGDTAPPVKNEWRYRYSEYYYEISVMKQKSVHALRSDAKPVIKGNFIGVYDKETCTWKFYSIRETTVTKITKYAVKVRYILLGEVFNHVTEKYGINVGYRKDKPIAISTIDEEW